MPEEFVRETLAHLLQVQPADLSLDAEFGELGVDSIVGLRFARKLAESIGSEVELEWLFDYPTISKLTVFLRQKINISALK